MPLDLKKKAGPLSRGAWVGVGGATFLLYFLFKRYEASKSASAVTASNALLGGNTIPTPGEGSSSGSGGSGPATTGFSDLGSWEQAAVNAAVGPNYGSAAALNDITAWINGQCVTSQGYNAISSLIGNQAIGLPPGFGSSLPPVTVCSNAPTPAPAPAPAPSAPAGTGPTTLQQLSNEAFPHQYNFGQFTFSQGGPGTQFTQVGTIENGQYQGAQILNGAPAYASVFGSLVQDFNPKTIPNGVGVYVPTSLVNQGYVPTAPGAPAQPAPIAA